MIYIELKAESSTPFGTSAAIGGVAGAAVGYGIAKAAGQDNRSAAMYAAGGMAIGFAIGGGVNFENINVPSPERLRDFYFAANAGFVTTVNSSKPYNGNPGKDGFSGTTTNPSSNFSLRASQMTTSGRGSSENMQTWVNRNRRQGYSISSITIDGAAGLGSDLATTNITYNLSAGGRNFSISPPPAFGSTRQIGSWQGKIPINLNTRLNINVQRSGGDSGVFDGCFAVNMRAHVVMSKVNVYRSIKFYGIKIGKTKKIR